MTHDTQVQQEGPRCNIGISQGVRPQNYLEDNLRLVVKDAPKLFSSYMKRNQTEGVFFSILKIYMTLPKVGKLEETSLNYN